ncbi:MAG: LLM class flavin-dependent oxidoreductase, partial [Chloroflexota bacterium]|nr:LLM class flavin-dependent oxidoreductase [Chloroflexota bacterium]
GRATHATWAGEHHRVKDARNLPKPIQETGMPIMVGGNGPKVTWRLAARFADELNLDWLTPDEIAEAKPVIASRCEEIGRDPATLRLSVNISRYELKDAGPMRVELLAAYREVGVDRVMGLLTDSAVSDEPLESLAVDARAAGCRLAAG